MKKLDKAANYIRNHALTCELKFGFNSFENSAQLTESVTCTISNSAMSFEGQPEPLDRLTDAIYNACLQHQDYFRDNSL